MLQSQAAPTAPRRRPTVVAQSHLMPGAWTTTAMRVLIVVCAAVVAVRKTEVDAALSTLWGHLRASPVFAHDSFEPALATLAFFPPLILFHALDMHSATPRGAWLRRYRVRPDAHDMSAWEWCSWGDLVADPTRSRVPVLLGYLLPLMAFDGLYPRRKLPDDAPGVGRLVSEIVALLVIYDALFFVVHRTLHANRTLFKYVHKKHHTNTTATRANDAVRLTFSEEVLDVACSIVAVNALGAHPLSRAIYNVVIVYLLVELHCGYDFPWMLHNVLPPGVCGGPVRHDEHHAKGTQFFQKFFCYLDDATGPVLKTAVA